MDFLIGLLNFLKGTMPVPLAYGWLHLSFVCLTIIVSVLMCVFLRDISERGVRIACLVMWLIILTFEIYKQIVYTFHVQGDTIVVDYTWAFFPFQLCSSPLYILPFVVFLPEGRVRDMMCSFMMAFSIFGGICVYAIPGDVFCMYTGINIQTMVHHGIQIVSGVFLAARYRDRLNFKYLLGGSVIFAAMMGVAMLLNFTVPDALADAGINEVFSMFYVSATVPCHLPVLSIIYPLVPFPIFVIIYFVGFLLMAAVIFYIAKGIVLLSRAIGKACLKNAA